MNTLTICKKTAVLCVSLGFTAPLFAQNLRSIAQGAEKVFEAPRAARGIVQRFTFPQQTVDNIHRAVAAGQLDRQVTAEMLNVQPIAPTAPAPTTVVPAAPAATQAAAAPVQHFSTQQFRNFSLVAGRPVEKELLSVMLEENKFYAPEIDAGRAIRDQILNISVLEEEGQLALATAIQRNIKNHTLKQLLLKNLENYDIYNMALDLTDYFCLDKAFEDAAFDYALRHPHQMNLNMRRLMYNPLVDQSVKTRLRYFLEAPSIEPQEYGAFRSAIRTAHLQYQQRLSAAKHSDIIQAQVAYYENFIKRLDNFIVRNNGVQPKWNTANLKERGLFDEYETVRQYDFINQFNPILTYRKQLQIVWTSAKAPRTLSLDKTVELFEEFVQTTGRRYPLALQDALPEGAIPFEQEELLWDSLDKWRTQDEAAIKPYLNTIINKYLP